MRIVRGLCAALLLLAIVQPAEARRFRLFGIPGFGSGEKIEKVYDLPDREPFFKDGEFLDVGYLTGSSREGYVLYSGKKFVALDAPGIALLTSMLGVDPTAAHRARMGGGQSIALDRAKAELAEEQEKQDRIVKGLMIEPRPGETTAAFAARREAFVRAQRAAASAADAAAEPIAPVDLPERRSSGGGALIGLLVVLAIIFFGARKLYAGIFGVARAVTSAPDVSEIAGEHRGGSSFDARVARRLAELQNGDATGPASAVDAPGAPPPVSARPAFGRKVA